MLFLVGILGLFTWVVHPSLASLSLKDLELIPGSCWAWRTPKSAPGLLSRGSSTTPWCQELPEVGTSLRYLRNQGRQSPKHPSPLEIHHCSSYFHPLPVSVPSPCRWGPNSTKKTKPSLGSAFPAQFWLGKAVTAPVDASWGVSVGQEAS